MSRIEIFHQLSLFFGVDFPYLNSSISKLRIKEKQGGSQRYPFSEYFLKKYFLEFPDNKSVKNTK